MAWDYLCRKAYTQSHCYSCNVKWELTETITEEYQKYQKEIKEDALDEKIKQLKKMH